MSAKLAKYDRLYEQIKDYSMYGNDGVAKYDIIWPQGIEIPKLNENNE